MTRKRKHTQRQTRRQFVASVGAAAGTVGVAAVGVARPAAASDPDEFGGVFGADFDVELDTWALIRGYLRRLGSIGRPPNVETLADRTRNEFDSNSEAWLSYGNWLLDEHGSSPVTEATVAVDFRLTRRHWPTANDHTETTLDVRLDSAGETVDELAWTDDAPEDADYHIELRNDAAIAAADELQRFRRLWIADDEESDDDDHELPSDEYLSELAGRHAPNLVLGDSEQSVLEILLGEVRA